jgi:hypothetical protein
MTTRLEELNNIANELGLENLPELPKDYRYDEILFMHRAQEVHLPGKLGYIEYRATADGTWKHCRSQGHMKPIPGVFATVYHVTELGDMLKDLPDTYNWQVYYDGPLEGPVEGAKVAVKTTSMDAWYILTEDGPESAYGIYNAAYAIGRPKKDEVQEYADACTEAIDALKMPDDVSKVKIIVTRTSGEEETRDGFTPTHGLFEDVYAAEITDALLDRLLTALEEDYPTYKLL